MDSQDAMTGVDDQFPVDDPLEALPPTAQRILEAARKLLAEEGFTSITLEKVAAAAGVNKASIRYHFGNKAGLVANVVDYILHQEFSQTAGELQSAGDDERIHTLIEGKRHVISELEMFRGFFDILPHAMRDEELRLRLSVSYPWWAEENLRALGLQGGGAGHRDELLDGLGRLISAVVDGLSAQAGLNPDALSIDVPLRTLELLLQTAMPQLKAMAQAPGEVSKDPARGA